MTSLPPGPAWLFVPGDRPERWAKAAARADSVIVDLENAIGVDRKDHARTLVATAADHVPTGRLIVRINAAATPWFAEDVAVVREIPGATVMVPKVAGVEDLARTAAQLDGVPLLALCETASSVLDARHVAEHPNCCGLMWGGEDLAVDMGGLGSRDDNDRLHPHLHHVRSHLALVARTHHVAAVDAPVLLLGRNDVVAAEARTAAAMGYQAKACIHPDQVAAVRAGFTPTQTQVAWAAGVVEAAAEHGTGSEVQVFAHRGQMVDYPVVELARAVLARTGHTHDPTHSPTPDQAPLGT